MILYMLTTGCYSDYTVEGIFSTREKAEAYRQYFSNIRNDPDAEIYEIELDPLEQKISAGLTRFEVRMGKDGNCLVNQSDYWSVREESTEHRFNLSGQLEVMCWAKDKSHAAKIANEIRTRLIAENRWPKAKE